MNGQVSDIRSKWVAISAILLPLLAGCSNGKPDLPGGAALVGVDPVQRVHLFENHSSSLVAWRKAGVRDRVVVHLDGHADFDWLPDETIARLAAAEDGQFGRLEIHPYAMDDRTLTGFSIWNFLYPAARLGMVRRVIWVVPDGTLPSEAAARELVRERLVFKMQMISLEEARRLRIGKQEIYGQILDTPIHICEIDELPHLDEPVLLDIDVDYFSTRDAISLEVAAAPWVSPAETIGKLQAKGLRTDLVTLSLSTIGGYLPPSARWVGRSLQQQLRDPGSFDPAFDQRRSQAVELEDHEASLQGLSALSQEEAEDSSLWYAQYLRLEQLGRSEQAEEARTRAIELDPMLAHHDLYEGDRHWINFEFDEALRHFDRYLERYPEGPFHAYVMRRRAGSLERLQRPREAVEAWRQVIELAPGHPDSRLDFALLLRELNATEQAIQELRTARSLLPDRAAYAQALGTTLAMNGQLDEGIDHLRSAVRRQPCLPQAHGNLSAALLQQARYQEAAQHLGLALWLQPNNRQYTAMARQLNRQGVRITPVRAP